MDSWPIKFSTGAKPTKSGKRKTLDTKEVNKEKKLKQTKTDYSIKVGYLSFRG